MTRAHLLAFAAAGALHAAILFGFSQRQDSEDAGVTIQDVELQQSEQEPEEAQPPEERTSQEEITSESLLPDDFLAAGLAEPPPNSVANEALTQMVRPSNPRPPSPDSERLGIPDTAQVGSSGSNLAANLFTVDDLDRKPAARVQMAPRYPYELQTQKLRGHATILMIVDEGGRISSVRIEDESHPAFGQAARDACLRWRFDPGLRKGAPVRFWVRQRFDFSL